MRNLVYYLVVLMVLVLHSCGKEPEACFTYNPSSHAYRHIIWFSNCSENAEEYLWDFNGMRQSKEEDPVIEFAEPGEYQVTLTATSKRREDVMVQTVHVAAPLSIRASTSSMGTHYRKQMKFDLSAYAKAGLGVLSMIQVREGRTIGGWDSVVVDSPIKRSFAGSFRFRPKWSNTATFFHFMVMDKNGLYVTDSMPMPTLNGGDSTQGKVKSIFANEAILFDTGFAFSRGTYVQSTGKINLYLVSKNKDYVYIHDFGAIEGELKTFSCQIYSKQDGFAYKNLEGKNVKGNRLKINKLDLDEMVISGHLETPVLFNNRSIDKLTTDFENVRITRAVQ